MPPLRIEFDPKAVERYSEVTDDNDELVISQDVRYGLDHTEIDPAPVTITTAQEAKFRRLLNNGLVIVISENGEMDARIPINRIG